jgi:hypothetical protein
MHRERNQLHGADERRLARVLVIQLLRDDHQVRWSRDELVDQRGAIAPSAVDAALGALQREGVVCLDGASVWASDAVRRLDELELICV